MVTNWKMQPGIITTKFKTQKRCVSIFRKRHLFKGRRRVMCSDQFGIRAFSGPLNIVPTFVACSLEE